MKFLCKLPTGLNKSRSSTSTRLHKSEVSQFQENQPKMCNKIKQKD